MAVALDEASAQALSDSSLAQAQPGEHALRVYRELAGLIGDGDYRELADRLAPALSRAPNAPLVRKLTDELARALVSEHLGDGPEGRLFIGVLLCLGVYPPGRDGEVGWLAPNLAQHGGIWELVRDDLRAELALPARRERDAPRAILHRRLARILDEELSARRGVAEKLLDSGEHEALRRALGERLHADPSCRRVGDGLRRALLYRDLLALLRDAHSRLSHPLAQPASGKRADELTATVHRLIAQHIRHELALE